MLGKKYIKIRPGLEKKNVCEIFSRRWSRDARGIRYSLNSIDRLIYNINTWAKKRGHISAVLDLRRGPWESRYREVKKPCRRNARESPSLTPMAGRRRRRVPITFERSRQAFSWCDGKHTSFSVAQSVGRRLARQKATVRDIRTTTARCKVGKKKKNVRFENAFWTCRRIAYLRYRRPVQFETLRRCCWTR